MRNIAATTILPAAIEQQERLARSIQAAYSAGGEALELAPQQRMLSALCRTIGEFQHATDELSARHAEFEANDLMPEKQAESIKSLVVPAMERLRGLGDSLERMVGDELWPLPKYREMLFMH